MLTVTTLYQQKKDLLTQERPQRAREAAKTLKITEAEYVALSLSDTCTMLDGNRFAELLLQLEPVGKLMALTRNDAMVLEHHGVYKDGYQKETYLIFNTPEIDLRLQISKWKYGFAVEEKNRQSLQFFDQFGEAAHKIYITDASDKTAYENILHDFSTTATFQDLVIKNKTKTKVASVKINQEAIHKDWLALNDVHQVNALLKDYGVTRPQAYRCLKENSSLLQSSALEDMLQQVSELQIPLLIFVSNATSTQIHNGVVNKLMEMGPWFNVLDPAFSLHANMELVTETWMVAKNINKDHPTYSMELFDANQETLMVIYLQMEAISDNKVINKWLEILNSLKE